MKTRILEEIRNYLEVCLLNAEDNRETQKLNKWTREIMNEIEVNES